MSDTDATQHQHGALGYLQLPAVDLARSAAFYAAVFGWVGELEYGSFTAPGLIGQWTTDRAPTVERGPLLWLGVDQLKPALDQVEEHGGAVRTRPSLDQGERWLVEVDDPAGNRIGIVAPTRPARAQTMLAVRDVEASSAWYQQVLGLRSDHGGPHYERLLAGDTLVLQLHQRETTHHHGALAPGDAEVGHGVLVWYEVADFDAAVARAAELAAPVVLAPHRNPPTGEGNGPGHRELWVTDPDGYTVVIASPDGEAYELDPG